MSQKIYTNLDIKGNATIGDISNATSDTDKFLVSDAGVVKYRTGSEMLSDLGVAPGVASNVQHQVKAGVAINKGQAVYVTSADGTNMIVGLASNASEATSSKTMGLLNNTVAINGFANVVTEGLLAGLNTIGANAGDPVWLGTNGNLIYGLSNKPSAPAHLVFIGIVTRVNANNGEIFIKAQNGFELNEIHDVDLKTTSPSGNEILAFEGAPVNLWKNKTIPSVLGYTPVPTSRTITINGNTQDLSANLSFSIASGVTSFNTRTGAITLTSGDVTTALGYTPYNATNPAGYITSSGSITGNAATATNADYANSAGYAGNSNTLDGYDSSYFATASHTHIISPVAESSVSPSGISIQAGPGSGNAQGWLYPYGTKLSAITGAGRSFEIMSTTYPDGQLVLRTLGGGGVWDSWKTILDTSNYSTYAVPLSRTITINGTSYDLSANRSWTVSGTVTSGVSITSAGSASNTPSTPSVNIGMYVDTYAFIDLATADTNGSWIDFSKANGTDYGGRIRYNNGSDYFSISAAATEQLRIFNSNAEALGSFRAPIFYDSNNTSYYLDPASTSNLALLSLYGHDNQLKINTYSGGASGWFAQEAGVNKWETYHYQGRYRWYNYTTAQEEAFLDNAGGYLQVRTSMRAPVFYDSNDTTYYFDGTGGTRQSRYLTISGGGSGNNGNELVVGNTSVQYSLQDTNLRPIIQATGAYPVLTLNHTVTSNGSHGATVQFTSNGVGNQFVIGSSGNGSRLDIGTSSSSNWNPHNGIDNYSGTTGWRMDTSGNVYNLVSNRSPIFYDNNDTGFYVDPNGSSNMDTINAARFATRMGSQSPDNSHPGFGIRPFYSWNIGQANNATAGYSNGISIGSNPGDQSYGFQIVQNMWDDQLYFRRYNGGWQGWRTALDNTNYSSYSNFGGNSVYGGIYYDANNTGYYLDPASGSNLYDLALSGGKHTYLYINPGNGYEAMVRYNGGSGNTWYAGKRTTGTAQAGTDGFHFYSDAGGDTVVGFGTDGTIRGKGDVVAYSSSDRQLKDNISPIENALEKVKQIGGYTFDWNNKQTIYEGHDVGVVAQEIESVLPEVVTTRDTGFKAVKYEKIVPLLIEAIKEQSSIIDKLINRIEKLESK